MEFTQEFRESLVKEAIETGNVAAVARKHGINDQRLHYWVKKFHNKDKLGERSELKKLRKELEDKDLEIAILKELLKKTNQVWLKE